MTVIELDPGSDARPDHDHSAAGQEEVFVVLRGTGEMTIDGETVSLDPETIVRVGPEAKRNITPGPEGMRLIALGGAGQGLRGTGLHRAGSARPAGVTSGR